MMEQKMSLGVPGLQIRCQRSKGLIRLAED
jgi:hypothetical protein